MRKNRITALLLSVVLAVTFAFGNVKPAQAAAVALAPEVIEVLYAILASAGVVAANGGSSDNKKLVIEKWYNKESATILQTMALLQGFEADLKGDYVYRGKLSLEMVKQYLLLLRDSFSKYVGSYGYPELGLVFQPWERLTRADVQEVSRVEDASKIIVGTGTGMYALSGSMSRSGSWKFFLYGVTPNGYRVKIEDFASIQPRVSVYSKDPPDMNATMYYKLYHVAGDSYCVITRSVLAADWDFGWTTPIYDSYFNGNDFFVAFFGGDRVVGIGNPNMQSVVAALSGATGVIDTGIDCDTWAGTLGRSLVDENKDVVILGGQDLANYNDVTTVREGLITGVDWADIGEPDIPIDPDAPAKPDAPAGSGSILRILKQILEWLKDILKWLKGLPALLAETIIGDGVLDWSGFQGVQLSSVFPFCIPWDLVSCVRGFNVQPTEPVFVFDFAGTPLSSAGTVRYDLSRFAVVIPIIRYFIYGIFVVGLIVKTRDLIRG